MAVPFHILTGFLGAGKTTLLDRLLRQSGERVAVLINEAGEVSLDHHLVTAVDGDVSVLASGCVCCTVRSELGEALERTLVHHPERIVLETTGLATPAPVAHVVATHPRLSVELTLASVLTVVDAQRGMRLLDDEPEVAAQLELADSIILTRLDLATPDQVEALKERLQHEFPAGELFELGPGDEGLAGLFAQRPKKLGDAAATSRWLSPPAGHGVTSVVLELPDEVDDVALMLWLRLVAQFDGPGLLRIKGVVRSRRTGEWLVLQSAQQAVSPPRTLAQAPTGWAGSRLVVHARGLSAATLETLTTAAQSAARGTS